MIRQRIKRNISFAVEAQGKSSAQGQGRVRCIITWNGQRLRLNTGLFADPKYWEKSAQRCKARTYHGPKRIPASTLNNGIEQFGQTIDGLFEKYESSGRFPSVEELRRDFMALGSEENSGNGSIFPAYRRFLETHTTEGRWAVGTLRKMRTIGRHLESLSPTLSFARLDAEGEELLTKHLSRSTDAKGQPGYANSTTSKIIKIVKTFLRWAADNGYPECPNFMKAKTDLRQSRRPVIFLTWEELMQIYHADFSTRPALEVARNIFCFCCFTSLRYSDVINLKRENVYNDKIRIVTIKTHDALIIELNKYSEAILNRYLDKNRTKGIFPILSNHEMNRRLKEIGRICGINEPIEIIKFKGANRISETYRKWELMTTHTGRRTFVCNALMLGISPEIVMKWTGHSDYDSMKPYIAVADDAKRNAMDLFNKI